MTLPSIQHTSASRDVQTIEKSGHENTADKARTTAQNALKFDSMKSGSQNAVVSTLNKVLKAVTNAAAQIWHYTGGVAYRTGQQIGARNGNAAAIPLGVLSTVIGVYGLGLGGVPTVLAAAFAAGLANGVKNPSPYHII